MCRTSSEVRQRAATAEVGNGPDVMHLGVGYLALRTAADRFASWSM